MEYEEYTCDTCGKKCSDKNLDKHMAIHLETLRFECDVCGKKYQRQSSLAKHMGSKHAPTPPPASEHHERSPSPEF